MDLGTAFWFFEKIRNDKFCLLYNGSFSDDITEKFIELSEYNLNKSDDLSKLKRRVSFLMAECFQNIVRHGETKKDEKFDPQLPGYFSTKNRGNTYFITSGNLIDNQNIEKLESQLNRVNSLSIDELKDLYRNVMESTGFSEKGGAGLGLIEMARRSGHRIDYSFNNYDKDFSLFYSQIKLAKENEEIDIPIKEAIEIHEKMNNDNILLIQKGDFSQESILPVLNIIEQNFIKTKGTNKNKSVYHVLVELLQNIGKHSLKINNRHEGIFLIKRINSTYTITAGNFIAQNEVKEFEKKLKTVRNANEEELEKMYTTVLMEGEEAEDGSAGLGLIDISRISKESLDYHFHKINDEILFFTIQVEV